MVKGKIDNDWGKYLCQVDVVVHLASKGVLAKKLILMIKFLNSMF